jgi:hypothetical protein
MIEELSNESGLEIPATIAGLDKKSVLHDRQISKEQMKETVEAILAK